MENESVPRFPTRFSVLVVDRHDAVRSSLVGRLRHASSVSWVEEAATVDDAKRIVAGARPDVVLLDPGGWEGDWRAPLGALTAVRPKGAIIALHVARPPAAHTGEARALGADCILLKGLKTDELVQILAREAGEVAE